MKLFGKCCLQIVADNTLMLNLFIIIKLTSFIWFLQLIEMHDYSL